MPKQIVDTGRIAASMHKLRSANNNINTEFRILETRSRQLDDNWNSTAGEVAKRTMYNLFRGSEVRSTVLQNYVNLLEQQVSPGYVNAETTNTQLADKFK